MELGSDVQDGQGEEKANTEDGSCTHRRRIEEKRLLMTRVLS